MCDVGKLIGETYMQVGVSAATYGIGQMLDFIRAQLITEGIVEALKYTTRRHPFRDTTAASAAVRVGVVPMYLVASYVAMSL
jgi:hypothetical protein